MRDFLNRLLKKLNEIKEIWLFQNNNYINKGLKNIIILWMFHFFTIMNKKISIFSVKQELYLNNPLKTPS